MKALILAAGRGARLDSWTEDKAKSMTILLEKPIIEYSLNNAVYANVNEIIIVVGYKREQIMSYIGDSFKGIPVKYVIQEEQRGVVHAIEKAKEAIGKSDFILMLGDEIISDAKINLMVKQFRKEDSFGVCGVVFENDKLSISKTYNIMATKEGRIFRLIEKPRFPINKIKGTGHCVFKNEIFHYIERTPINAFRGEKEMVDMIQVAIDEGKIVKAVKISDSYTNINTKEDFDFAQEMIKRNNPKVLIVHNQMKFYGGAELLIVELCNWLTKMGIKNDILTLSKSKEVERNLINTEIIIPKNNIDLNPPGYKNIHNIFAAIKIFRRKLKEIEKNYDVINFHDFPVTWALWPRKKPAVWFMNLPPNLYSKPDAGIFYKILNKVRIWMDRYIIRHSIDIITVAEELNKIRAKERYFMDAKFLDIGINYEFFSLGDANSAIKKWNLKNKFVIIQSGQICNVKNQIDSLKAVNKIKDKIPNAILVLAGKEDPIYKPKLDKYIQDNKLDKYVLFTKNLDRKELVNLYHASDVGLFPIGKQGGILAPLECACAEVPVIVSEEIGTASMMKERHLGIITKDYTKAILDIYKNSKEYEKQAKNASRYIKENMSWRRFTERMIEVYKTAWKKHKIRQIS